ncbi:MAG: ABC transporter permease [Actinomycetota bacterium]
MTAIDDPGSEATGEERAAETPIPDEVAELDAAVATAAAERKQIRAERRRLLLRTPGFVLGVVIAGFWVICAIVPGLLAPYGANEAVRVDGSVIARQGPSADAWFGTDTIGNDVFSRVIFGARSVLITAPTAAALATIAGTMLGLVMGYYRGWADEILGRIIEALLSIPVILLGIMTLVVFGNSRIVIILTVATLFTPVVTRTVRSAVQAEAQLDYVTSAKLRGESGPFIMLREILPNVTGVIVVEFTVRVGYAIFTIATLAFLGLAADDFTTPDWGNDISNTYNLIQSNNQWWPSIFPALAIASLVIAVNLIADSLDKVRSS